MDTNPVSEETGGRCSSSGEVLNRDDAQTLQLVRCGRAPCMLDKAVKRMLLSGCISGRKYGAAGHDGSTEEALCVATVRDHLRADGERASAGSPAVR